MARNGTMSPTQHVHGIVTFLTLGWFDALARQQVNDAATFARLLLQPLADDVRRWTWLHERYFCDGTQQPNRTWAYAAFILFYYYSQFSVSNTVV